jgi:hypothetical protein
MNKIGLFILFFTLFNFVACKKGGCISPTASNFDRKAKTDDGSCQYTASIATAISANTKDALLASNIDTIEVFIDGENVGFIDITVYDPDAINTCGALNVGSKELSWTGHSAKRHEVIFKDEDTELPVSSTYVNVFADMCNYAVVVY